VAWNPLRSERDMLRFLVQVGIVCLAVIVVALILRAIL
jgi:hypothetical protein